MAQQAKVSVAKVALREIAQRILEERKRNGSLKQVSESEINRIKKEVSEKYALNFIPKNSEILSVVKKEERRKLAEILKKKPVRTISGVSVIAVMSMAKTCPHGRCIYCPRGDDAAQSYTGYEPASLRARSFNYDAYKQVEHRLRQLYNIGHNVEKAELIIMGGTFLALDREYKESFVKACFDAMNNFFARRKLLSKSIEAAQRRNEKAKVRNVGLTFETRADYCKKEHVDEMLYYGATRVEIGVQSLREEIYKITKRAHKLEDVIEATRIAKDAGLKVCYHMMPGLFSTPEEDLAMFKELFSEQEFRPDMLKIYPTLVIKGTELYEIWKEGKFKPYDEEIAVNLIASIKQSLPEYVRVMRIQRDIPAKLIAAGVKHGNLGELVEIELNKRKAKCRCIRCREIGHAVYRGKISLEDVNRKDYEIKLKKYDASDGVDFFISAEIYDYLLGYLRLRFPSENAHRKEIKGKNIALVRELKVCGEALSIGESKEHAIQHRGIGAGLLEKAEEIAEENKKSEILVRSAVGTREYYRKLGYRKKGAYMAKKI